MTQGRFSRRSSEPTGARSSECSRTPIRRVSRPGSHARAWDKGGAGAPSAATPRSRDWSSSWIRHFGLDRYGFEVRVVHADSGRRVPSADQLRKYVRDE